MVLLDGVQPPADALDWVSVMGDGGTTWSLTLAVGHQNLSEFGLLPYETVPRRLKSFCTGQLPTLDCDRLNYLPLLILGEFTVVKTW